MSTQPNLENNFDLCSQPLHPAAALGIDLFNEGLFYEAHEALEDAWREEKGPIRELYQAILQAAVTYFHIQNGNIEGGIQMEAKAMAKLEHWPDQCCGLNLADLKTNLAEETRKITDNKTEKHPASAPNPFKPILFV